MRGPVRKRFSRFPEPALYVCSSVSIPVVLNRRNHGGHEISRYGMG
jgi:hypothetical protein